MERKEVSMESYWDEITLPFDGVEFGTYDSEFGWSHHHDTEHDDALD
jgi:hypothetical protein